MLQYSMRMNTRIARGITRLFLIACLVVAAAPSVPQERTEKPPLHGQHWMAITGKPLGATAGARIFQRGGNAVDAACAMIAATATMWDVLHWEEGHRHQCARRRSHRCNPGVFPQ